MHGNFLSGSPLKFIYFFRGGVGQFGNIYVLIDIPFKGCQGRSNRLSIVHAVSYFACGVNDTTFTMHAVSLTPHASCMQCHCHWHDFALKNRSYLGEFEAEFKMALALESRAQELLFVEKKTRR
jgi:hypothetical protein